MAFDNVIGRDQIVDQIDKIELKKKQKQNKIDQITIACDECLCNITFVRI